MITLDEEKHEYRLDGVIVPSVTQIIDAAGLNGDAYKYADEYHLNRGRIIHKVIEYYMENRLSDNYRDPMILGYLDAWIKFVDETGFYADKGNLEKIIGDDKLMVGGTIDAIGNLNGAGTVVDAKSGLPLPSHGIQLAAYECLYRIGADYPPMNRVSVHLKSDGTYKMKIYPINELRRDREIFFAALRLYHWKKENLK